MTLAGILALNALSLVVLIWILDLVRRGRLYVGYGVIFVALLVAAAVALSVAPLRTAAHEAIARLFPDAGPVLLALYGLCILLVYVLAQVTVISNRLSRLVQELAIREAKQEEKEAGGTAPPA